MIVRVAGTPPVGRPARTSILDIAAEVLVADPSASLSQVAAAAGIGRTTLHKHYATRDDLIRAVGHRAIDLWEIAIDSVPDDGAPDGGLRSLTEAAVAVGPQLGFLWRTPAFDHLPEINDRSLAAEQRCLAILGRARSRGLIAPDVPDWWLLQTFYSLVYVAAESVRAGRLAPRDAPDLAIATLLHGIGTAARRREGGSP
jgi:AcrR family transcriptional regulator